MGFIKMRKIIFFVSALFIALTVPVSANIPERLDKAEREMEITEDDSEDRPGLAERTERLEKLIGIEMADGLSLSDRLSIIESELGIIPAEETLELRKELLKKKEDSRHDDTGSASQPDQEKTESGMSADDTGDPSEKQPVHKATESVYDAAAIPEKTIEALHKSTEQFIRDALDKASPDLEIAEVIPTRIWVLVSANESEKNLVYDLYRISFGGNAKNLHSFFTGVCYRNASFSVRNPSRVFAESANGFGDLRKEGGKSRGSEGLHGFSTLQNAKKTLIDDAGNEWIFSYLVFTADDEEY